MTTLQPAQPSAAFAPNTGRTRDTSQPVAMPRPESAVASADQAMGSGAWGELPLRERIARIKAFRELVANNTQTLVHLIQDDVGKPAWEAMSSDVLPLLGACRFVEKHAASILRTRNLGGAWWLPGVRTRVSREPLGRVAIIATWNYPVQLLGIQLVQALIAGNRVVVKPSERSPRSQALLVKLAHDAGVPTDALELRDADREAGRRLLEDERFDHIVFTGSLGVGRAIAQAAARTLTPTTLELSGADSVLVLDDADTDLAARVIFGALTLNAGQTCMAPRRVLVHRAVYAELVFKLARLAAAARPVALVDESAAQRAFAVAVDAVQAGGRSLTGVLEAPEGRRLRPMIIADCPLDTELARGEHFGPALALTPVDDERSMLTLHARCEQALATGVFTRRPARARAFASRLTSGQVTINDLVLPSASPCVGIPARGASGWGVTRGAEGLLAMTRPVYCSTTSTIFRLPPEPPAPGVQRGMRTMIARVFGNSRRKVSGSNA